MRFSRIARIAIAALVVGPACVDLDLEPRDPRVGELGQVRFTGGGCSGSTTLAVGATERLTMEAPAEGETLPTGLGVVSEEPGTIEARAGETANEVLLEARRAGEALIEVREASGELYDQIGFTAVPASRLDYRVPTAVFAGGTLALVVNEVYGRRDGEEIVLLGGGFVDWDVAPASLLAPLRDERRVALFRASGEGQVLLAGLEPSAGERLVSATVTVLPADDAVELTASMGLLYIDNEVAEVEPLPTSVPVGALFQLQVVATTTSDLVVPIARFDLETTLEGAPGTLDLLPLEGDDAPEGPALEAIGPGEAVVAIAVPHLGLTARYSVTVTESSPASGG